jgi:hypothetical protein
VIQRFSCTVALAVALIASIALSGCAGLSGTPSSGSETTDSDGPMTQARMELLFADMVKAIMGPPGAIQTRVEGVNVYLIRDPENDRMRIVAPIAMLEAVDPRVGEVLLRANFHSTRDARYAVSDGVFYAAFLHPISSLSPDLLESALAQILSLTKTFGSTFSSGALEFGTPREAEER